MNTALFDSWTDKYDRWFTTSSGRLLKKYETELLLELLYPQPGEKILDVGCGTGIFTEDVLDCGTTVVGIDLSLPMLKIALERTRDDAFSGLCSDMCALPFPDNSFDKVFSMTAIEFVADAEKAIAELNRVTRKGGCIVVTTLNSLSPWAIERQKNARDGGHSLFQNVSFRSPQDMRLLVPHPCVIKTAIHFQKNTRVEDIPEIELQGNREHAETGAFLAVQWHTNEE